MKAKKAMRAFIERLREMDALGELEPELRREVIKHAEDLQHAVTIGSRHQAVQAIDRLLRSLVRVTEQRVDD